MNINEMKEPILAIDKDGLALLNLKQGFNPMSWEQFLAGIDPADVVVGERQALEVDFEKRHFIPYLLVKSPYVMPSYFMYQRGKGIGEERLLGNMSCGLGGHPDREDIVYVGDTEVVDLRPSLDRAARRELDEELEALDSEPLEMRFIGLIIDDSNEVGQVHIGAVYMINSPEPEPSCYKCIEPELQAIGLVTCEQALAEPKLENWSRFLMTYLIENESGLDGEDSACDQQAEDDPA